MALRDVITSLSRNANLAPRNRPYISSRFSSLLALFASEIIFVGGEKEHPIGNKLGVVVLFNDRNSNRARKSPLVARDIRNSLRDGFQTAKASFDFFFLSSYVLKHHRAAQSAHRFTPPVRLVFARARARARDQLRRRGVIELRDFHRDVTFGQRLSWPRARGNFPEFPEWCRCFVSAV